MVDREKVIRGLECCKQEAIDFEIDYCPEECPYKGNWDCIQNLCSDTLELLKEQEPKPVKVTKNVYNYEFYQCPNCGRDFELTYYKRPAYCDKCGQELKWDD